MNFGYIPIFLIAFQSIHYPFIGCFNNPLMVFFVLSFKGFPDFESTSNQPWGEDVLMKSMNSVEREIRKKTLDKLTLEIALLEVETVKREAELELIKEQIRHKQFTRKVMKVTTTITGLSLITTVLMHFGLIPKT